MNNTNSSKIYVQYGAGNIAIPGWVNFDASPTLRLQKIPLLGKLLQPKLNCVFDDDIRYGNIVKGLPIAPNSVSGLFCSHVLEHLSYMDFMTALKNSFEYLKPGGVFRIIVPDLEFYIKEYQKTLASDNPGEWPFAAIEFCKGTCFGVKGSRSGFVDRLTDAFRNSNHRWMWDYWSMSQVLTDHGFVNVKRFQQGDCDDEMFLRPERDHQFGDRSASYGLALECTKPF